MNETLGLLETRAWSPAIVALDAMFKAAQIRVIQAELNDFLGVVIKIAGADEAVRAAIDVGCRVAEQMGGSPVADVVSRVDSQAWRAIDSAVEYNPLIQQDVVHQPGESNVASAPNYALGLIETQGFTAVFEAIDTACKAARVEVVGKEKLGGGYVTVVIKGDVAAVTAAVDAGQSKVAALGKLIAAHVIARPSEAVLSLLPK